MEKGPGELSAWDWGGIANKGQRKSVGGAGEQCTPPIMQARSKSNAELSSTVYEGVENVCTRGSGSAPLPACPPKPNLPPSPTKTKVRHASNGVEEKWVFKGKVALVDLEVVVTSPRENEERRFELLSPETSFAVYAGELFSGYHLLMILFILSWYFSERKGA